MKRWIILIIIVATMLSCGYQFKWKFITPPEKWGDKDYDQTYQEPVETLHTTE